MQKYKKVIASVMQKDNKVLIAQRAKKDALYEKWEFPGGKMEAGETDHECLKRELREEFGIEAEIGDYVCTSYFEHKGTPMAMVVYYVSSYSGEMQLLDHKQVKWVTIDELDHFQFPDPDLPIVEKLKGIVSE